jgi:CTP:molybdopterin cytidylyltransferase MocA
MIILAAGLSERMGVFKPLLPADAQPAVLRCVRASEAAGISDIIVVTGFMRDEIEKVLRVNAPNVRLVYNDKYPDGMFSSVCAGVSAAAEDLDGFFLLPADCCAVSKDTLEMLMRNFAESGTEFITRPKYWDRRGHPPLIPARYRQALVSYNGENGLKGFLSPLPTAIAETDDRGALLDMDTPDDYSELLSYLGLPVYPSIAACYELFEKYNTSRVIIRHGERVAALALKAARLMETRGACLDTGLLESSCLLHDVCKTTPDHAAAGMKLLLREGYPRAAILVGRHMDLQGYKGEIAEAELLYLADKLCISDKFITLDERMSRMKSQFAHDPEALAEAEKRINTARAILDTLTARYGACFENPG